MKNLLLILFILISLIGNTQIKVGKNLISLSATGNTPYFSGAYSEELWHHKNGTLESKRDWLDYGAIFKYAFQLNKKTSIGLLANYHKFEVPSASSYEVSFSSNYIEKTYTNEIRVERFDVDKYMFMPIFEFYHRGANGPFGLYHTIGVGYSFTRIKSGHYAYSEVFGVGEDREWSEVDYFNLDTESISYNNQSAISLFFGFGMRYALTPKIGLDYGLSYNINLPISNTSSEFSGNAFLNSRDVEYSIRREQLAIISLNLGLAYVL